jgi:hypothetical protein
MIIHQSGGVSAKRHVTAAFSMRFFSLRTVAEFLLVGNFAGK